MSDREVLEIWKEMLKRFGIRDLSDLTEEKMRKILGDELVEEIKRYVEEMRKLSQKIPKELIETDPLP